MPFIPPVIITSAPQPESSEAMQRQQRMLDDMQDELKMIRKVLAERQQPVRVTLKAPRVAAAAAPKRRAGSPRRGLCSAGGPRSGRTSPKASARLPPRWSKTAGLMDYLAGLAEYLPDEQRKRFDASDVKLRMEYIRERLRGASGLMSRLRGGPGGSERAREPDAPSAPEVTVTSERVAGALRFLKGLDRPPAGPQGRRLPGRQGRLADRADRGQVVGPVPCGDRCRRHGSCRGVGKAAKLALVPGGLAQLVERLVRNQ